MMAENSDGNAVRAGGLVTVAFLKAQLDSGSDLLGMFIPLAEDALRRIPTNSFTAAEIQVEISSAHGLVVPLPTLITLLRRAISSRLVRREAGRYWKTGEIRAAGRDLAADKAQIEIGQARLAEALQEHARRRGIQLETSEAALEALMAFVSEQHVAMLLQKPPTTPEQASTDGNRRGMIAEFVRDVVAPDKALASVLSTLLEGLVLYNAAFQLNINPAAKTFKNLTVVLDSVLVRQAIGYEGTAAQTLMLETIEVLRGANVSCIVFDKTVDEIQRILRMYESHLGTSGGRRTLHGVPMARHFLTMKYSPADVRQLSALLDVEVHKAGIRILPLPKRVAEFTSNESALAQRLARPESQDAQEPRVLHDVDCVAGVLVMRRGHVSHSIEDAGAVFATTSPLVIQNTGLWWREDERGSGIEPIVHIRAIANLAWLKRPRLTQDFKLRELFALCAAAMKPSPATWDRFLRHLRVLELDNRLSSDEVTAIVVSSLSDDLLRNAELDDDGKDLDAATLDEIVERVKASYVAETGKEIERLTAETTGKMARLHAEVEESRAETLAARRQAEIAQRSYLLSLDQRSRFWGRLARWSAQTLLTLAALVGAGALIFSHHSPASLVGILIGLAVILFVLLETFGVLRHVQEMGSFLEVKVTQSIRRKLESSIEASKSPWSRR